MGSSDRDGWTPPRKQSLPEPTYMPLVMALGIACILWGIVTSPIISGVGGVLFVIALAGWIGDLRHEHGEDSTGRKHD